MQQSNSQVLQILIILQKAMSNSGISSVVRKLPGLFDYTHLAYRWVTTCFLNKLFTDKTVRAVFLLFVSPESHKVSTQESHLLNLYLVNDIVDRILTDKSFLNPLVKALN